MLPRPWNAWARALNVTGNLALILSLGYLVLRADGPLRTELQERRDAARLRRTIRETWNELISGGGRLNDAQGRAPIVEFGDYECPSCRRAHRVLDSLPVSLRAGLVYLHFPLSQIHPAAEGAARASICAEMQQEFREWT